MKIKTKEELENELDQLGALILDMATTVMKEPELKLKWRMRTEAISPRQQVVVGLQTIQQMVCDMADIVHKEMD